ncbi:hypothetical protein [Virgibacillus salexigens]|uniref:DUF3311 domain-containing protein n=2 Tax=Virgibacillus TaxID=84406 RepID=A0A024Q914_9BACI|nr:MULTISPECIES: hypothetical protein [Virgibacillus]MYL40429.1 hypothetical protein [Virgibacillus massiliensis]GGJ58996.1 hypothetical protein GCM10007111_21330 [Virgibacillus kapii]CDQ38782.1 hypothetical protein BN990_01057 [Virgibacillus massiliensis]
MKLIKEPIKNWKLWVVFGVLFLLSVPWYFPTGSYKPIILGIPYWAWIILFVSIAFSATITFAIKRLWITEEITTERKEDNKWNKN